LPAPPFRPQSPTNPRTDFATHVVDVETRPNGAYVVSNDGFSGGHNADNFLAALNDPKQTGRPPPGRIENSEPVYGPGGEIVGETLTYRLPKYKADGVTAQTANADGTGPFIFRDNAAVKTVYYPDKIPDAQMVANLERAGTDAFDKYGPDVQATVGVGRSRTERVTFDGLTYEVRLKVDANGDVVVENAHLVSP